MISLLTVAVLGLPNGVFASDKKLEPLVFSLMHTNGDSHNTSGITSTRAFALRGTDYTVFFSTRGTLYAPSDITVQQGPGDPLYAGWHEILVGAQRPVGAYTLAVWTGPSCTNGGMEWVQKRWHKLRSARMPSDDLLRPTSKCYLALGGEAHRTLTYGARERFSVTPYVTLATGYERYKLRVGADALWGARQKIVGPRDPVTGVPHTIPLETGLSLSAGLSHVLQDAPYLDRTGSGTTNFTTVYLGVQQTFKRFALKGGVAHLTEKFDQQDDREPVVYINAVWGF